jgi:type I restriction enzyme S subunit
MTYSIIKKSQLEGTLRMDAEYYQPEFLDLISKIKNQKSKLLGEIGEIVYGTTPAGGDFEEKGIPFIRSQNFSLLNINDDFVFCSKNFHQQNQKSKIEPGNILFAAVGATIGQLAIVQDKIKEANINQNIAAIKINNKKFNPYFVGLFFASHLGQLQIERLVTGNAQFYLNTEQIKNFNVPFIERKSQDKIAKIFKKAQKELELSK